MAVDHVPGKQYPEQYRKGTAGFVMASGRTIKQCAADLGINDKTLSNWVADRKRELGVEGTARLKPAEPKADPELAVVFAALNGAGVDADASRVEYVSMIYDTGHLTFSGEDPIEILKKHHDRIGHVHLKNVRKPAMDKCYAENKSFLRSIPEGVFTVPGDPEGCVDFPTVFKLLDEYNYEGWLVVEAEQDPAIANPLEYARMARAYVKEHTGL